MSSSLAPLSDPAVVGHYRVTVEPSGDSFVVRPGENILAAGRRAGVWLPFECGWGSCGTCKAT
ncbi:2Fe-2S iron-sulfur cluster-binding protein, partial [Rhodococcus zopfii]